jgi:hypothetical protein
MPNGSIAFSTADMVIARRTSIISPTTWWASWKRSHVVAEAYAAGPRLHVP